MAELMGVINVLLALVFTGIADASWDLSSQRDQLHLASYFHGPVFLNEPPQLISFGNNTGLSTSCTAQASPAAQVSWIEDSTGLPLVSLPGLREVYPNGSINILPFSVRNFRSDVHSGDYRCLATNPVGTIISRKIRFRGVVVTGNWKPVVENKAVWRGNVAVLSCTIEENSRDFLSVTGWSRTSPSFTPITAANAGTVGSFGSSPALTDSSAFLPIVYGHRYSITSTGDLLVSDTNGGDFLGEFRCQVTHELTGEIRYSNSATLHVSDPGRNEPVKLIYASPPSVRVRVDDSARIGCVAHGNPAPVYKWFRRDRDSSNSLQPVDNMGGGHLLLIERASLDHSGIYVCIASNPFGEIRRDFVIQVTSPLSLHVIPQRQEVSTGRDVTFNCSVSGHPVNEVRWLKDGKRLFPTTDRIRNPSPTVLQIGSVTRDDEGMYQCFVFNDNDMAQAPAQLTVSGESPSFKYTFIEQTVPQGSYVSLKCVIRGYPTPIASWLIDGEPVRPEDVLMKSRLTFGSYLDRSGDVITHLNLTQVGPIDGGEYSCLAKNILGEIKHEAWLNVFGNPVAKPPRNITTVAGFPRKLNCPVGGYPLHNFQWTRFSAQVRISDILYSRSGMTPKGLALPSSLRQKVDASGSLLLDHVERGSDDGIYVCDAENKQGRQSRGILALNVVKPPEIAPFQFPSNLREGMRAQVSCSIISGDLPITITWYKDHEMIQSGDIQTLQQQHEFGSNLLFTNITAAHNGLYTCLAVNNAAGTNYTARLVVKVEPTWTREPQDMNVRKGASGSVACQATGYPTPTVSWLKAAGKGAQDFIPLSYNPRVGLSVTPNGSLSIQNADEHHEGHYLCAASNGIGPGKNKVVHIQIDVPAYFRIKEVNQTARVGDAVMLLCEVEGDVPIQISWGSSKIHSFLEPTGAAGEKNRAIMRSTAKTNGMGSELFIKKVGRGQSDTYYCRATNAFGGDTLAIHLSVKERPQPPLEITPLDVQSRVVLVKMTAGHDGGANVNRFVAQSKTRSESWAVARNFTLESNGNPDEYLLRDLRPAQTYNIRFFAVNDIGTSDPSAEIVVEMLDEAPSAPPLDVHAESNSSRSVIVTWNPPSQVHINGKLVGYQVHLTQSSAAAEAPTNEPQQNAIWTVKESEARLVVINKLEPFTRYEVTVRAFNRMGPGPTSPRIVVQTQESVPSEGPGDVNCTPLSGRSLRLRWSAPEAKERNGHIVGYKVYYHLISRPGVGPAVWPAYSGPQVKRTTNPDTQFTGLVIFGNYSVRVSAYSRKGNGVSTRPIYCNTGPDVPGPPEAIKVAVSTSSSLIASWLPPRFPNGVISKYNVYVRNLDTRETRMNSVHVRGDNLSRWVKGVVTWELRGLREEDESGVEIWITAVNSQTAGTEGEVSASAIQTVSSRVGAQILEFNKEIVMPAGQSVTFPCTAVGLPAATHTWTFGAIGGDSSIVIQNDSKWNIKSDGSLQISATSSSHVGNFTCYVENIYGKDSITYTLKLRSLPVLPAIAITDKLYHKASVLLEFKEESLKPADLYLKWRKKTETWNLVYLDVDDSAYVLNNLTCGTTYQVIVGYYDGLLEESVESKPVEFSTLNQDLPLLTQDQVLIRHNSSVATFRFPSWVNGNCPVGGISIELKEKVRPQWDLIYFAQRPFQTEYTTTDLKWMGKYDVRIVGENAAGKKSVTFSFDSADASESKPSRRWGAKAAGGSDPVQNDISNFLVKGGLDGDEAKSGTATSTWDLHVIVPVVSGVICTVAMMVCLGVFVQRRKYTGYRTTNQEKAGKVSLTEFYGTVMRPPGNNEGQPEPPRLVPLVGNNQQLYFPTPQRSKVETYASPGDVLNQGGNEAESYYEICPYATFDLVEGQPGALKETDVLAPGKRSKQFARESEYYAYLQMQERQAAVLRNGVAANDYQSYLRNGSEDVYSLGISYISNQPTLPIGTSYHQNFQETSFDGYSLRRGSRREHVSDSDEDSGRRRRSATMKARSVGYHSRGASSTESAEDSPMPVKKRPHGKHRNESLGRRSRPPKAPGVETESCPPYNY